MNPPKFVTVINCMDGRVQAPVWKWMRQFGAAEYVDLITEPGADLVLSEGPAEKIQALREKALLSVRVHSSKVIAVVGHYNCAANPSPKAQHLRQIRQSVEVVSAWGTEARILGLWVNRKWEVELVQDFRPEAEPTAGSGKTVNRTR